MGRRGYTAVFVLVLLMACAGGFLGGRFLIRRLQQDFGSRTTWAPPAVTPSAGESQITPTSLTPARPESTRSNPARPIPATATPARIMVTVPAPEGVEPPTVETATAEPKPVETAVVSPSPSPVAAFPFLLSKPVRHSTGDCPGNYILGLVTDRSGNPLSAVRLLLIDEYGNQEIQVTKAGADAGRYDFPIFGPPRRFYLTVVDAGTRPTSPRIEISHGVGADAQATCHWADWRRQ